MAGIWAEVLHRPRVGRNEDFFDLGGHSLLAAQASGMINDALAVDLTLRELFEAPTVADWRCRRCNGWWRDADGHEAPHDARPARDRAPPRSHCRRPDRQRFRAARAADLRVVLCAERLWLLDRLMPTGDGLQHRARHCGCAARSTARRCERALDELVRRHEVLRTRFA